MANTTKQMSLLDAPQIIKGAQATEIQSLATTGFLQLKVGHKIEIDTVSNVQPISYYDGATLLMTIECTYTDPTLATLESAERIA